MKPCLKREQKFYDALAVIAREFDSVEKIMRNSESAWGLDSSEALQYSYENMQGLARNAIRGMRRPKIEAVTTPTNSLAHRIAEAKDRVIEAARKLISIGTAQTCTEAYHNLADKVEALDELKKGRG